jgi:hypothetical protein
MNLPCPAPPVTVNAIVAGDADVAEITSSSPMSPVVFDEVNEIAGVILSTVRVALSLVLFPQEEVTTQL